ncbi:hypothetical protein D3C80_1359730 [compost metagenome]
MQHAGKCRHAIQLLMTHDAQVVDITFYLTQLGAERVDLIAIAKGDHPALKGIFQHDPHPAGDHREIVKAADLIVRVFRQHGLRCEKRNRVDNLANQLPAQFTRRLR